MSAREWYRQRAARWAAERDAESRRGVVVSRLRLATFLGGAAVLWWGIRAEHPLAVAAGGAAGIAFVLLVAFHARVLAHVDRAEGARVVNAQALARLGREWGSLAEVAPLPEVNLDTHPYARDLDLFGHASLTRWLGPTSTEAGRAVLQQWLLGGSDHEHVTVRQAAIADLAGRAEWRESLATEGRLIRVLPEELTRLLEWVEADRPAVPRTLRMIIPVLTAVICVLVVLQITRAVLAPWWLIPMLFGVVLSFAYGPAMQESFRRARLGERALRRYATMLALACREQWSSAELCRLQNELRMGGDAPAAIKRLALLAEWSELRIAAALLHFPIQALTLWDFHISFALDRWRARSGRRVRAWLSTLGCIDALAVLSAVRHDQADWAFPSIDPAADELTGTALGHPLLADDQRVTNDVVVGPRGTVLLITGSNMSGKSTLLRAIGLNVVLAQAGAPVCAGALRMPVTALRTSIRVEDSLELGLSYFMAALARLKAIVDAAEQHRGSARIVLYLLDEVLQGTNSAERSIAVRAVARHLMEAGAIGAMTTHDLSLAEEEPLASAARLVHFSEQVHGDGSMTFDYRLRPGLATSRNALRLMQLIGIEPRTAG